VAIDATGNAYVATPNTIYKTDATGARIASMGAYGSGDGTSASVQFRDPTNVAVDRIGNLYVSDNGNHTIRKGVPMRAAGAEPPSRLVNASVRANLIAGRRLIPGFVMSGGAKPVLVRAIGPGLSPFFPDGTALAADPRLELYGGAAILINANDNWGGGATLRDAFTALGAFPFAADSADAALLHAIEGPHTAHALSVATGIGLIEVYDAGPSAATDPRLINFSSRYEVGGGAGALILGFVIEGTGAKTVLIRGVGPALAQFGVNGALADPRLEIYNGAQEKFAESDNWTLSLASLATQVGAFALPAGSKDASVLLTLQPGLYTAVLTGTGEGLVEVYEVQ